ncbi:MAG: epoxyqueuosine reductase QueH [Candidatus Omnitrophota bacterium]
MKLLLHCCCAPCLIYPLQQLKAKDFEVAGIFYNPNIHPFLEYKKRKETVEDFSRSAAVDIIYPDYKPEEFFQSVNLREKSPGRCSLCWQLRLKKTADSAKELGFEYFSTTLLVSPYQDQESLKNIGMEIEKEARVRFYYEDFRAGFRQAHQEARSKGMYCQNYCGCIYSEIERYNSRKL